MNFTANCTNDQCKPSEPDEACGRLCNTADIPWATTPGWFTADPSTYLLAIHWSESDEVADLIDRVETRDEIRDYLRRVEQNYSQRAATPVDGVNVEPPKYQEDPTFNFTVRGEKYGEHRIGEKPQMFHDGVLEVVPLGSIARKPQEWLWQDYLPLGTLVLVSGDPGGGKSTMTMDWAARVSNGGSWPDGSPCLKAKAVVVNLEDSEEHTIAPRLIAAGADPARVLVSKACRRVDRSGKLVKEFFKLTDVEALRNTLEADPEVRLVVIDPVSACLAGVDSHKDADIRQLLTPLSELANEYRVTIVLVTHLNKGGGGRSAAMYRSMGSIGILGAARAAYVVCKSPDDPDVRLLLPTKGNLAKSVPGRAFRIEPADGSSVVRWDPKPSAFTADEVLNPGEANGSKLSHAKGLLEEVLSGGPRPSVEVEDLLAQAGVSEATTKRAKKDLKVVSQKTGFGGEACWTWSLPRDTHADFKKPIAAASGQSWIESDAADDGAGR